MSEPVKNILAVCNDICLQLRQLVLRVQVLFNIAAEFYII